MVEWCEAYVGVVCGGGDVIRITFFYQMKAPIDFNLTQYTKLETTHARINTSQTI
jgi:hypothetical protein